MKTNSNKYMNHIKKFNEDIENQFYSEISADKYVNFVFNSDSESFSSSERQFLISRGYIPQGSVYNIKYTLMVRTKINDFPPFKIETKINKIKDEWFLVKYNSSTEPEVYYKCDQFDGLVSLLDYLKKWPNYTPSDEKIK